MQGLRDAIASKNAELNEARADLDFYKKGDTESEAEEHKASVMATELAGIDGTISSLKQESAAAAKASAADVAIMQQQVTVAQEQVI